MSIKQQLKALVMIDHAELHPTVREPEAGNLYFDDNASKVNHLISPVKLKKNLLWG